MKKQHIGKALFLILGITSSINVFADTGFVITDNRLLEKYVDGNLAGVVHKFSVTAEAVSYTGDAVYVGTDNGATNDELKKCSVSGNCNTMDKYGSSGFPQGVSFNSFGDGFVATSEGQLHRYKNGKFDKTVHVFKDGPEAVSFAGNNVYVTTHGGKSNNYELKMCDTNGTCDTLDHFDSSPNGVSFDSFGKGFVVTNSGHLDRYIGNKFDKIATKFDGKATAVSYTGKNVYVAVKSSGLTTIYKCDSNGTSCKAVSNTGDDIIGMSFLADGASSMNMAQAGVLPF